MNIAIISMTDESIGCINRISNDIRKILIIEKDYKKWNKNENGITICSLDKALQCYRMHEINYFLISKFFFYFFLYSFSMTEAAVVITFLCIY